MLSEKIQTFVKNLPDPESAVRFYSQLLEKHPAQAKKLDKNEVLLSDVLTLAAFSPLLAATLLQHPDYIWWLARQRISAKVRGREEMLESLARFALTNSQIELNILLARFRRRELLRIYLRDIRNLGTIAEITEEISSLADAVLEYALRQSQQELDNRYGIPLEIDKKERAVQARFCVVALGKLGSNELNYASDIDLLFLYSNDGTTSGQGLRGTVTNREYFVKLAEIVTKLVGGQTGEGAAYRVDLRLRPHGRVGALAISVSEAVNYYKNAAQSWERQVLIRSRACAGNAKVFQAFFEKVKSNVFSKDETVENALRNVRLSKEKINLEKTTEKGFNVKLGKGGIREIEFIAQALQIAYGGNDVWLRSPHTLISLTRLADRKLLTETELTELFEAYDFLRRLEHRLQMENGLQTHLIPGETQRLLLLAGRMNFSNSAAFEEVLSFHTANVSRVFSRIFGTTDNFEDFTGAVFSHQIQDERLSQIHISLQPPIPALPPDAVLPNIPFQLLSSLKKSNIQVDYLSPQKLPTIRLLSEVSPHFAAMLVSNPALIEDLPKTEDKFIERDYKQILLAAVRETDGFARELSVLRKIWSRLLLEIIVFDISQRISLQKVRTLQTKLAEASIEAALLIVKKELARKYHAPQIANFELSLSILGLGKLGGGGMDYGSDLDLIMVYDENSNSRFQVPDSRFQVQDFRFKVSGSVQNPHQLGKQKPEDQLKTPETLNLELETWNFEPETLNLKPETLNLEPGIFYARAVEIFVTVLSSLTRDGYLYRVDLRLRPDGKNGATSSSKTAFLSYLENRSAVWEWLAYIKLRGVGGDLETAKSTENAARKIIHENAHKFQISDSTFQILSEETRRIRQQLLEAKSKNRKGREIDIKFGEGGMLDVYFAVRFLQLRHNVPDDAENRSTLFTLKKLSEHNFLSADNYQNFSDGYAFLSELDHNLRLTVGRSTSLPVANQNILKIIAGRMKLDSINNLLENLTLHRLNIRASFEDIFRD